MNVSKISFGNKRPEPRNYDRRQEEAIVRLWKYYQQTNDFRPAQINFYEDGRTEISLIGELPKTSRNAAQSEQGLASNVKQFVTVAQSKSEQSLFAKTKYFIKKLFRRI